MVRPSAGEAGGLGSLGRAGHVGTTPDRASNASPWTRETRAVERRLRHAGSGDDNAAKEVLLMGVAHDHDDSDDDRVVVERDRVTDRAPSRTVAGTTGPNIVRLVLTILGAAAMIFGSFLQWVLNTGNGALVGTDLPLRSFYRPVFTQGSSFISSPGAVMILLGLIALLGMAGWGGWLTRIAGALGIIALVLVVIEMNRADLSLPNDIGPGMWVALAGSVVALVGGFFSVAPYLLDDD
jgi:hypothetical protein